MPRFCGINHKKSLSVISLFSNLTHSSLNIDFIRRRIDVLYSEFSCFTKSCSTCNQELGKESSGFRERRNDALKLFLCDNVSNGRGVVLDTDAMRRISSDLLGFDERTKRRSDSRFALDDCGVADTTDP